MENLKKLRAKTSVVAKENASRASNASSAVEAKEILKSGLDALMELYESPVSSTLVYFFFTLSHRVTINFFGRLLLNAWTIC